MNTALVLRSLFEQVTIRLYNAAKHVLLLYSTVSLMRFDRYVYVLRQDTQVNTGLYSSRALTFLPHGQ